MFSRIRMSCGSFKHKRRVTSAFSSWIMSSFSSSANGPNSTQTASAPTANRSCGKKSCPERCTTRRLNLTQGCMHSCVGGALDNPCRLTTTDAWLSAPLIAQDGERFENPVGKEQQFREYRAVKILAYLIPICLVGRQEFPFPESLKDGRGLR